MACAPMPGRWKEDHRGPRRALEIQDRFRRRRRRPSFSWAGCGGDRGKLEIPRPHNGVKPAGPGATPILVRRRREHSYSIAYRNRRPMI